MRDKKLEVAGLDGTKAGWVAVLWKGPGTMGRAEAITDFETFIADSSDFSAIAIDVPIGLLDEATPGGRDCDRAARRGLGHPKGSSVFSPPVRRTLVAKSYDEAKRLNAPSSDFGIKVSIQAYSILPKIREIDGLMRPELQKRIYEAHPELSFCLMNDRKPMLSRKSKSEGRSERLAALRPLIANAHQLVDGRKEYAAKHDDVIDAMAMAWTAWRIANGQAEVVPGTAQIDNRGLKMQIWG